MKAIIDGDPVCYDFAAKAFEREDDEKQIDRALDDIIRGVLENTKASHYLGFLGGGHSFRRKLSLQTVRVFNEETKKKDKFQYVRTYKGDRDGKPKHRWYWHVRDRMVKKWGFQVVFDIEADDAVAICNNYFENAIIAAIDKDMKTIPCLYYNIRSKRMERITAEEANFNYYKQVIAGDSSDCITGIPGMGEVKACEFLNALEASQYEENVLALYEDTFGILGREAFSITKRMVKLLHSWPYFKIPEPIPNPQLKLVQNTTPVPLYNLDF